MDVVARLDDYGKPAWITAMVIGFVVFWPIGLLILGFLLWSGRMKSWGRRGRWYYGEHAERWGCGRMRRHARTSGNLAFDEYREETLKRLEEEQQEFEGFLERLRHAKDKAEFDQFMAERRSRPAGPEAPEGGGEPPRTPQE
jgi:hypothetical protein